jgi:glutaconate CoA-transferase subunit A
VDGNVEIAGARGCDLSSLFPAKRVLVTVEEQVPNGMLATEPNTFIVPRSFISTLAVSPLGAYPTSCLPYYSTDYFLLRQLASRKTDEPIEPDDLKPQSDRSTVVREMAQIPAQRIIGAFAQEASSVAEANESYTVDELMACCIARTIDDSSICSVGSVSPLATVAYLLAKRLWAPNMCLITYNGGFIDVPFRPMAILASEVVDFKEAVTCAGGDETYHWYYQRGMITHEVVSAAQIDRRGATNNIFVLRPDGSMVRLPGQGGMADVANMHRDFFLYLTRHSPASMVEAVNCVSAKREVHQSELRRAYGYQPGVTRLLTNLGQFQVDPEAGELLLTHLHPGVTLQQLQDQTGFQVHAAPDLSETQPPTSKELKMLRTEVDPLGIRRLEFVPSAERSRLIDELLEREEKLLQTAAATAEGAGSRR